MRVCILYQAIQADASPDEKDVLQQVDAVGQALVRLGHRVETYACTLNLEALDAALNTAKADIVFNLVESVAGTGRLIHLPPALLDARRIHYTGSSAESLFLTSHKIMAKELMRAAELPTPMWMCTGSRANSSSTGETRPRTWLMKSVWEHASIGMDGSSFVRNATPAATASLLASFAARMGDDCFAEAFIDGREFNIGLLAGPKGPESLPPAEIVFTDFPADKPRIVGYQAKWATESFEYRHTNRCFAFAAADAPLLAEMKILALQCWDVFNLGGYARVDFRVDAEGHPWILEINTNPCISPEAGFAAMVAQAGLSYDQAVERILDDAIRHRKPVRKSAASPQPECNCRIPGADGAAPSSRLSHDDQPARGGRHAVAATPITPFIFRNEIKTSDREAIGDLARATGFFHDSEIEVAVELVDARLAKGPAAGYEFVIAELNGHVAGYACFGLIPCTASSYDLYWIAVRPEAQGKGLGRFLLEATERRVREMGGTRIYAETSSRPQYLSTRAFYERTGYHQAELLADYYAPGDGRATYLKVL